MMLRAMAALCAAVLSANQLHAQSFETATEAVANMGPGWNLGNTLDAHNGSRLTDVVQSETMWGQPVTRPELMAMMKAAGFGVIRVPVTWYPHMSDDGQVDEAWMHRVREVVDYIVSQGMYCLLNVHHDTGEDSSSRPVWLKADETVYNDVHERYEELWRQIAQEFRDYDHHLLFESYNEMLDVKNSWCYASFAAPGNYDAAIARSAYSAINSYAQSFVNTVRATGGNNAQRNLVVNTYGACSGSGTWSSHLKDPLQQMQLPTDKAGPGHIIFQVHAYHTISNLSAAKREVDDMLSAVQTHLVSKGAPVVFGEWGTFDSSVDYASAPSKMKEFARYFITQAKQRGMGAIYWMGLSDGSVRSLPAFSQPDLAECIVKAWRGDDFQGQYPTWQDFDITYVVRYTGAWQELNLLTTTINRSDYQGIRVVMSEPVRVGSLQVKCYGESDGKEQYADLSSSSTSTYVAFSSSLGSQLRRITLQTKVGAQVVKLKQAFLVKSDGSSVELTSFSPFWGCTMEMQSVSLGIDELPSHSHYSEVINHDSGHYYDLSGRLVSQPARGIYVRDGQKVVVR